MTIPTNSSGIAHCTPASADPARKYQSAGTEYLGTHGSVQYVDDAQSMETIELYTRPGCPFCMTLRRRLRKAGIEFREINIWRDSATRARVRVAGNGNETVPTVQFGGTWLGNPSVADIVAHIHRIEDVNRSTACSPERSAP